MHTVTLLVLAAAATAATAQLHTSDAACDGPFRADAASGVLVDVCGRQRYFRGLNSVIKGPPYYPEPHTFTPGGSSLSPQDAAIWQSLGFNLVRLGVLWAGAQPSQGVTNTTYLSTLASLSASLYTQAGIFTLLDAHQDLFSGRFCADGAPTWIADDYASDAAAFPSPLTSEPYPVDPGTGMPPGQNCSQFSWGEYYVTSAVGSAFDTLYSSSRPDYASFWAAVVAAYSPTAGGAGAGGDGAGAEEGSTASAATATAAAASASVLGYEVLNEPWAGDVLSNPLLLIPGVADAVQLQPFYGNLSLAIRAAEAASGSPTRMAWYEPVTWDNFFPAGFSALPEASQGLAGLSYHYYSLPDIVGAAGQVKYRAADAARLGTGALLTEFDVDLLNPVNPPYSFLDLRATLDACDAAGHGYIGWDYSALWYVNGSSSSGRSSSGGSGDGGAGRGRGRGAAGIDPAATAAGAGTASPHYSLVLDAIRELARPFPLAIAGHNASWSFTVALRPSFSLSYTHNLSVGAAAPTVIYLSTGLWFVPATNLQVNVTSVPAGAVTWSLQQVNGTVVPPVPPAGMAAEGEDAGHTAGAAAADGTPSPTVPPTTFAYALLTISTTGSSTASDAGAAGGAGGAAQEAQVQVSVGMRQ